MEIFTALIMGFVGSFHCIGMCGPIAVALPVSASSGYKFAGGRVLYNIGRIISYSIMGAVFGLLGKSFSLYGYQQGLSIALGIAIILVIIMPRKYRAKIINTYFIRKTIEPLKNSIGKLFKKGTTSSLFVIGFLNGFLPCGFVYMGLAGAMATGGIISGMLFMGLFGLGTFPAMFAASVFGKFINLGVRSKLNKAVPLFAALLAVIFILRGMNLGIPYLSPKFENGSSKMEMMHNK